MADPSTIQFNTDTVSGGTLGVQAAVPRVGIEGGGVQQAPSPQPAFRWFDSAGGMSAGVDNSLPEFLTDLTTPALENVKQQRMWEGFVAAREGQQLDEIKKNSPWYSKVFGPTNFEMGAITYEAQTRSADLENEIVQRMPELRQKTPMEMARVLNEMSQSRMTGNSYADAILQKTFMTRAQTIMDLHTQERTAWQNTEALKQQFTARKSAVDAYQSAYQRYFVLGDSSGPDKEVARDAMQAAKVALADVLGTVPENQTDESLWASTKALYRHAAMHAPAALRAMDDDFGMRYALPIERQAEIESIVKQGEKMYLTNLPPDDPSIRELVQWDVDSSMGFVSPEQTVLQGMQINDRIKNRHGLSEGPLGTIDIQNGAQAALTALWRNRMQAAKDLAEAQERANTEAEKRALEDQKLEEDLYTFRTGSLGKAIIEGRMTETDANRVVMKEWDTNRAGAVAAAARQYAYPNYRKVIDPLKSAVQQMVPMSPDADYTPSVDEAVAVKQAFENAYFPTVEGGAPDTTSGQGVALAYFGEKQIKVLNAYEQAVAANVAKPAAWKMAQQRVSEEYTGRGTLTQEEYKTLAAQVNDLGPGLISRTFGGREKFAHQGYLLQSAVQHYQTVQRTYPGKPDVWAREAVKLALASDTDMAGQFSWRRREGMNPIASYAKEVPPERFAASLSRYMRKKAKAANLSPDLEDAGLVIVRLPDDPATKYPVIQMMGRDAEGNTVNILFGKEDFLKAEREAFLVGQQQRAEAGKRSSSASYVVPGLGPAIN